jgi:hypothetical protein
MRVLFFALVGIFILGQAKTSAFSQQATPQYNPFSGKFEMGLPGATPQYNPHSGNFEMALPGAAPQYNPSYR